LSAGTAHAQLAGAPAEAMRFPYVAALSRESGSDRVFFCAGTLVAPRWILTAAHCFFGRDSGRIEAEGLFAIVGSDRLGDAPKEQQVAVDRVTVFPSYDPTTQDNDIALVRLAEIAGPLTAELPGAGAGDPATATVVGFGSYFEGELAGQALTASGAPASQLSDRLRRAQVRELAPDRCATLLGGRTVGEGQICAGAGPRDACVGDSGAPLVIPHGGDEALLIGLVSLGSGCAVPDPVVVYTRVAAYVPWIAATIAAR
jgi:secreted trypsin-like serine protease